MSYINLPADSVDAYGQLSTGLDHDLLLTKYIEKGLVHGYSVSRKLVNISNNLQAFRIRRSNDNAEQDIGFIGNDIDTASLLSFVGVNDGFVVTIYDQVGSNNATQSTAGNQWRIVNSGSLETISSIPGLRHVSTIGTVGYTVSAGVNLTNLTFFGVFSQNDPGSSTVLFADTGLLDAAFYNLSGDTTARLRTNNNTVNLNKVITASNWHSYSATHTAAGSVNLWIDNEDLGSGSITANTFTVDTIYLTTSAANEVFITDSLIFDTVLNESDRYNVNKNIDNFFGI